MRVSEYIYNKLSDFIPIEYSKNIFPNIINTSTDRCYNGELISIIDNDYGTQNVFEATKHLVPHQEPIFLSKSFLWASQNLD